MDTISLILLMGGNSSRYNTGSNKVLTKIMGIPLFMYSLNTFNQTQKLNEIILVINKNDEKEINEYLENTIYHNVKIVYGGTTRALSVINGLKAVHSDYCLIHDAARPVISLIDINNLINETINKNYIASYLGIPCVDTLRKQIDNDFTDIKRDDVYLVSTPQMFRNDGYNIILNNKDINITDEITLFNNTNNVKIIRLLEANPKLTYPNDLEYITYLLTNKYEYLSGITTDFHPFSNNNKPLILGGVVFDEYPSIHLDAWSDGDVVYHSISESIMGALKLGDLGMYFSDKDQKNYNLNSKEIMLFVKKELDKQSCSIQNIDITLYLEKPKINSNNKKQEMLKNICNILNTTNVCIKAATLNTLLDGKITTNNGIACQSIVLIKKLIKIDGENI